MKKILSFIAVAALMLGITSCEVFPEDAFSTAPVAPGALFPFGYPYDIQYNG